MFKQGNTIGALMTGIEQWLLPKLGFKSPPWTIHRKNNRQSQQRQE